ncbi:MAG: hypothetical protein HY917_02005, partial [Candidatus Diapherotrites archaeon]|nr:hypothetical protein [Candidatus Diapherotrites archaeon]
LPPTITLEEQLLEHFWNAPTQSVEAARRQFPESTLASIRGIRNLLIRQGRLLPEKGETGTPAETVRQNAQKELAAIRRKRIILQKIFGERAQARLKQLDTEIAETENPFQKALEPFVRNGETMPDTPLTLPEIIEKIFYKGPAARVFPKRPMGPNGQKERNWAARVVLRWTPAYAETAMNCFSREPAWRNPLRQFFALIRERNPQALRLAACYEEHEKLSEVLNGRSRLQAPLGWRVSEKKERVATE